LPLINKGINYTPQRVGCYVWNPNTGMGWVWDWSLDQYPHFGGNTKLPTQRMAMALCAGQTSVPLWGIPPISNNNLTFTTEYGIMAMVITARVSSCLCTYRAYLDAKFFDNW